MTTILSVVILLVGALWLYDHQRLVSANREITKQWNDERRHYLDQTISLLTKDYQRILDELNEVVTTSTVTIDGKEVPFEDLPEETRQLIESQTAELFDEFGELRTGEK